jgi:hypothetical protein
MQSTLFVQRCAIWNLLHSVDVKVTRYTALNVVKNIHHF